MEQEINNNIWGPKMAGNYYKKLKQSPVYGPVNSRRLGLSLGINPIQGGFACNWSCVYCQYGLDDLTESIDKDKKIRFTELGEIEKALKKRLQSNEHYDSLTICGPTEPTLHPEFNEIVELTINARNKYRSEISTSLFTNATELGNKKIKELDYVFMKLDAGNEKTFKKFNRARNTTLENVVGEIRRANVKRKIIQTMLCGGEDGNFDNENIIDYVQKLGEIKPDEVHLYSVLYASLPNFDISPIGRSELNKVAKYIESNVKTKAMVFVDPVKEGEQFRF